MAPEQPLWPASRLRTLRQPAESRGMVRHAKYSRSICIPDCFGTIEIDVGRPFDLAFSGSDLEYKSFPKKSGASRNKNDRQWRIEPSTCCKPKGARSAISF